MTTNKVTSSLEDLKSKIEANRYDYFTLPVLDITVKYRKPDMLKLSLNNSLPGAMADVIINAYKEAVGGADMEQYKENAKNTIKPDNNLIQELDKKGYILLSELVVSHKFLDVPESDLDAQPIPLISWIDVPEEDAIAFLLNLVNSAQKAKTVNGGEVTSDEVTEFSGRKRRTKRSIVGEDG
jgi:hypothetical protein